MPTDGFYDPLAGDDEPAPPKPIVQPTCKGCGCTMDGNEVEFDEGYCDDCDSPVDGEGDDNPDSGFHDSQSFDDEPNLDEVHVIDQDIREAPMYRDGISTTKTYLILATKINDPGTYNCICQGNDKIKFYPNKEYFGIEDEDLTGVGINLHSIVQHHGYERYMCSRSMAIKLLTLVNTKRGTITMSAAMAAAAPRTGQHETPRRGDHAD